MPDRTGQVAGQGAAATHKQMRPTPPARPHWAGRQSGSSHNTQTNATNPAGQTALSRSPVREQPQHTNATNPAGQTALDRSPVREQPQHTNKCDQPRRPDRIGQVAGQGAAATHKHMQPTLLARPHWAGRRSGSSCNTQTHATNPAGQTALGRSPVRKQPQHTNTLEK